MRLSRPATTLLFLFAFSGVSGLIYQSVWSHYLGLTLGHAAYAQTLVLAIFMGAMALGAWLASRKSGGWSNPIAAYAVIEGVIGVFGLAFHAIFVAYLDVSQGSVLPALSERSAHIYQWVTAALLILPQCVLLGMTFPLLSAGFIRADRLHDARALGGLYFTNSLGAAIGALLATFVFLPRIGMPGAMTIAGVLNLVVAAGAWLVARRTPAAGDEPVALAVPAQASGDASPGFAKLMMVAAGITGATSFVYEIVWVRLLNQALGTTLHSFELMLAAFIAGLAFGGLWIARRGERIGDAVRYAGIAQVAMGVAALLSAPAFANSFAWVGWLTNALPRTAEGYTLYNLGSAAIALAVMFPAAFFAGMTLPLFTMALLRKGHGEASIGRIYAANTLGAIVGVIATVHVLIPAVGLNLALVIAAFADLALGVYLLRFVSVESSLRLVGACAVIGAVAVGVALLFGRPDPLQQSSGVFRTGKMLDPAHVTVARLQDGKTSTVSVLYYPNYGAAAILTNGKPDAALSLTPEHAPQSDEFTMMIAASLPLATHPDVRTVATIGWGSGVTAHTVLGSSHLERLDSVEIEPAMYESARLFGDRVGRAYADPRSHLIIDDARTYFATGGKKYDVIISEPSNPWVSGVASLFTDEFYVFLAKHLEADGLLAQWIQGYEISDALLARAVSALLASFPYVDAYLTNSSDLVFLASRSPLPAPDYGRLQDPGLAAELVRVGLDGPDGYAMRRIGTHAVLRTYVKLFGAQGNSDYYPVLALEAPRSRFMGDKASFLPTLAENGMPVLDMLDGKRRVACAHALPPSEHVRFQRNHATGCAIVRELAAERPTLTGKVPAPLARALEQTLAHSIGPVGDAQLAEWSDGIAQLATWTIGLLPAAELNAAWLEPKWLAPGQPPIVADVMRAYRAAAQRDAAAMEESALVVLSSDSRALAPLLREQMLVAAMLGAAAQQRYDAVRAIEQRFGPSVHGSPELTSVRIFLLAWSDR